MSTTTGQVSASTKGTTISNLTESNIATITCTGAGGKTGSVPMITTQQANYIVQVTPRGTYSGKHFYYENVGAGATSAPVTLKGAVTLKYTSGAQNTSVNSSYATITYARTYSLATVENGFTSVNSAGTLTCTSLGTTITEDRRRSGTVTSVLTVTATHTSAYSAGGSVSGTMTSTGYCWQAQNMVTGLTQQTQPVVSYSQIPAYGGHAYEDGYLGEDRNSNTGVNGTVVFHFSSGAYTTTVPVYGDINEDDVYFFFSASPRYSADTYYWSNP